jgi:uncharacterized Zn finger protein
VLDDQFDLCEAFAEYLYQRHPKSAWHTLADRLLINLDGTKYTRTNGDFHRKYERDRLSSWAIHALERSGRKTEIIPLCEAEARKTGSYDRLIKQLVAEKRYEDAEHWIREGIADIKETYPGIASDLRGKLQEIRTSEKNWPVVAAMQVEAFVRYPSQKTFMECQKASHKAKVWPKVREFLLRYLEKGDLPWRQKGWPLPESGLDRPNLAQRDRFPLIRNLIDIAILEKKPDQVLIWYDRLPKNRWGRYFHEEDNIATAIKDYAPERAVQIWQKSAETLIAQTKPSAYQEAAKYLRKAAKIMAQGKKQAEWDQYIKKIREVHFRKRKLMEILDSLDRKPIVKKKR